EPLAEIAEERAGTSGERRQRRIVAHRGRRLVPMGGRRTHDHRQLFARVSKEDVAYGELFLRRCCRLTGRAFAPPLFEPAPKGASAREPKLDRIVLLEAALRIDGEHLSRPEPPPASARPRRHVEDARLGGAADEVPGDDVAKGTQAVAVE